MAIREHTIAFCSCINKAGVMQHGFGTWGSRHSAVQCLARPGPNCLAMSSYLEQHGKNRLTDMLENMGKQILETVMHIVRDPSSPSSKRALGMGALLLIAAYLLLRKGKQRNTPQASQQPPKVAAPTVVVGDRFRRIPIRQKVTVVANDTVFDQDELKLASAETAASHSPPRLSVIQSALPALCELARCSDLYLVTQVSSDAGEEAVRRALSDAGIIDSGLNPHKILFCETEMGRGSIVRQLEPAMHVDTSTAVSDALRPFVPSVLLVQTPQNSVNPCSVPTTQSLAAFFEAPQQ